MSTAAPEKPPADVEDVDPDTREAFIGVKAGITPDPIVDLDREKPEQTVRFGGKLYRLKTLDEFGLARQHSLDLEINEYARLYGSEEELSETDEQRLVMLVDRVFNDVLEAPASVKKRFTESQRAAVVLGFRLAPSMHQATAVAEQEKAREQESTTTS